MVNWYQKKFSMSSDLLHTCSCPFLCFVLVLTWCNDKPDQGVKLNLSCVLTPAWVVAGSTECGCSGQRGRGEGTCPGWHWSAPIGSRLAVTRCIGTPLPQTPPPRYREKINPGFLFPGQCQLHLATRGARGWRVSGLEQPERGAAAGPALGSGALNTCRGCSEKGLEMPGKKSVAETQIPVNEASGKQSNYVKTPFLLFHSGLWVHCQSNGDSP